MGSEDLHHKRKGNNPKPKKLSTISPISYMLIVCEGITEKNYFDESIIHYRISSANVTITSDCGSDPVSVVEYAEELYKREKKLHNLSFDKVFCIFDQDQYHLRSNGKKYQEAMAKLKNIKPKNRFFGINSVPCFEYWFLLHYYYTTKQFLGVTGQKSSRDQLIEQLIQYWPTYNKTDKKNFEHLMNLKNDELKFAIDNACRSLNYADSNSSDNPTTKVFKLINFFQKGAGKDLKFE